MNNIPNLAVVNLSVCARFPEVSVEIINYIG